MEYEDTDLPVPIGVRFVEQGGRFGVGAIHIEAPGGVTGDLLRAIPTGTLELFANSPDIAVELRRLADEAPAVERDTTRWLSAVLPARITQPVETPPRHPSARVQVPTHTQKRPDHFYRELAQTFTEVARWSSAPAQEIATASGVPVTTVHRWVKEARRRGLLGRARRTRKES